MSADFAIGFVIGFLLGVAFIVMMLEPDRGRSGERWAIRNLSK